VKSEAPSGRPIVESASTADSFPFGSEGLRGSHLPFLASLYSLAWSPRQVSLVTPDASHDDVSLPRSRFYPAKALIHFW
jgi:hypothetical protein